MDNWVIVSYEIKNFRYNYLIVAINNSRWTKVPHLRFETTTSACVKFAAINLRENTTVWPVAMGVEDSSSVASEGKTIISISFSNRYNFQLFFYRNLEYVCKENGRCIVDVARRNQCQACRFKKCLEVNMKRDGKWKTKKHTQCRLYCWCYCVFVE